MEADIDIKCCLLYMQAGWVLGESLRQKYAHSNKLGISKERDPEEHLLP